MWKSGTASAVALLLATALCAQPAARTGKVVGRLLGPLAEGVPAATVEIVRGRDPHSPTAIARSMTDAEGLFVIRGLPLGETPLFLRAVKDGYSDGWQELRFQGREPIAHPVARLWSAAALRVRVLDLDDQVIEGAELSVVHGNATEIEGLREMSIAPVPKDGCLLRGVPLGPLTLSVRHPRYELYQQGLELREDADLRLRLRLAPQAELSTTVAVEIEGLPTGQEATVHITALQNEALEALGLHARRNRTQGGRLSVRNLPEGLLVIEVEAEGYRSEPERALRQSGSGDSSIAFRLEPMPARRLHGRVVDTEGQALAGRTIAMARIDEDQRWSAVTDADGRFEIESPLKLGDKARLWIPGSNLLLRSGRAAAETQPPDHRGWPGFRFRMTEPISYEVGEENRASRPLRLSAIPTETFSGRALHADGQPMRLQPIELRGHDRAWLAGTTTDLTGHFTFSGLLPTAARTRLISHWSSNWNTELFELGDARAKQDPEFRFSPVGSIEGRVLDADGRGAPGIAVLVIDDPPAFNLGTPHFDQLSSLSNKEGHFRIEGIVPGERRVVYASVGSRPSGPPREEVEVRQGESSVIELRASN